MKNPEHKIIRLPNSVKTSMKYTKKTKKINKWCVTWEFFQLQGTEDLTSSALNTEEFIFLSYVLCRPDSLASAAWLCSGWHLYNSLICMVTRWLPQLQASSPHLMQGGRKVAWYLQCLTSFFKNIRSPPTKVPAHQGAPEDFCQGLFGQNFVLWWPLPTREPGKVNM